MVWTQLPQSCQDPTKGMAGSWAIRLPLLLASGILILSWCFIAGNFPFLVSAQICSLRIILLYFIHIFHIWETKGRASLLSRPMHTLCLGAWINDHTHPMINHLVWGLYKYTAVWSIHDIAPSTNSLQLNLTDSYWESITGLLLHWRLYWNGFIASGFMI